MIYKNVYKKFAICQGLLNKAKQMNIADDFCHHQLTDMMIQETHMPGFEIHEIESSSGEILYLYFTGHKDKSVAWTGIFVRPSSNVNFTPVSERTYMIKVKSNNSTVTNIISGYAPTFETTVKKPEAIRAFYKNLSSIFKTFKAWKGVIIGAAFNGKTKSKFSNYPKSIIGKDARNDISRKMIEFCILHNQDHKITFSSNINQFT